MTEKSQPGMPAAQPTRLFQPSLNSHDDSKYISEITLYDQETGLTNLLHRLRGSRFSEVMESEMVISVDGVLSKHDVQTPHTSEPVQGAWAVFFGEDSKYNRYGLIKEGRVTTGQQAELHALKEAMKGVCQQVVMSHGIRKVVIMTHSEVLEKGFSNNVWWWERNEWKTIWGTLVVDAEAWKELHELIKGCEKMGVVVEFLRVRKRWNEGAVMLATMALELGEELGEEEKEVKIGGSTPVTPKQWSPAITYFLDVAPANPEVRGLCVRLRIVMATRETFENINDVLRRLIIAGEDTPENFRLLFGSEWEAGIKRVWSKERIEILRRPPQRIAAEWWSPRAPNKEEEKKLDMERLQKFMARFRLRFK